MSKKLPQSRDERINEAIRHLGEQVRELRRELEEVIAALRNSPQFDGGLFHIAARRNA